MIQRPAKWVWIFRNILFFVRDASCEIYEGNEMLQNFCKSFVKLLVSSIFLGYQGALLQEIRSAKSDWNVWREMDRDLSQHYIAYNKNIGNKTRPSERYKHYDSDIILDYPYFYTVTLQMYLRDGLGKAKGWLKYYLGIVQIYFRNGYVYIQG